jgi:hypothetical protein
VKRKLPFVGSPAAGLARAAEEWRPAAAIAKAPLPVAVAGGSIAGGVLGGSHAADEGQQVDSVNALRRDRRRRTANQALFEAHQKLIEFGPLGSSLKYRMPAVVQSPFIPPAMGAYEAADEVRARLDKWGMTGSEDPMWARGSKGGMIHESALPTPSILTKVSGYSTAGEMKEALKRHEIIHSIQAAKRGGTANTRIRDLVKDEIGAYATMNRRMPGTPVQKAIRAANGVWGVGVSTAGGTLLSPRLRARAGKYAAAAAGAGILAAAFRHHKAQGQPPATDTMSSPVPRKSRRPAQQALFEAREKLTNI